MVSLIEADCFDVVDLVQRGNVPGLPGTGVDEKAFVRQPLGNVAAYTAAGTRHQYGALPLVIVGSRRRCETDTTGNWSCPAGCGCDAV